MRSVLAFCVILATSLTAAHAQDPEFEAELEEHALEDAMSYSCAPSTYDLSPVLNPFGGAVSVIAFVDTNWTPASTVATAKLKSRTLVQIAERCLRDSEVRTHVGEVAVGRGQDVYDPDPDSVELLFQVAGDHIVSVVIRFPYVASILDRERSFQYRADSRVGHWAARELLSVLRGAGLLLRALCSGD
jgi:hypothetical protein